MAYDFDLFVIGAGSGGVRAGRMASQYGAKVAMAEESRVGGTCVIRGCVPKKLMVYSSEYGEAIHHAAGYGWQTGEASFTWETLRDRVGAEVDRLNQIYHGILDRNDITFFDARAVIKDAHTVHLVGKGEYVTAEKILIATGGYPARDHTVDPDGIGIVSDDVFHLEKMPKRLIVAGGGYIAIEFAHIFAGLGSEVTLVYRGDRLLKSFDDDVSARVESDLKRRGIRYISKTVFAAMREQGDEKHVELTNGETLVADQILWAIGRKPKTEGMGLTQVGVELDRDGAIIVDDDYQTTAPSIFALGDVTNRVNLTPVAIREGAAFASTQFGGTPKRMDYGCIPKAVFAQPPVGTVGMSEREAVEAGHEVEIFETDFRPMQNVLAESDERMMMKLVVDKESDRVLGCHIVGHAAGEMIQIAAIAVKAGLTKQQFDETCALHPTSAEELVTISTGRAPKYGV